MHPRTQQTGPTAERDNGPSTGWVHDQGLLPVLLTARAPTALGGRRRRRRRQPDRSSCVLSARC
jgi:hypothetical protein